MFIGKNAALLQSLADMRRKADELQQRVALQTRSPPHASTPWRIEDVCSAESASPATSSSHGSDTHQSRWGARRRQETVRTLTWQGFEAEIEEPQQAPVPHDSDRADAPEGELSFTLDLAQSLDAERMSLQHVAVRPAPLHESHLGVRGLCGALQAASHQAMALHLARDPQAVEGLREALESARLTALELEHGSTDDSFWQQEEWQEEQTLLDERQALQDTYTLAEKRIAEEEGQADELDTKWQALKEEHAVVARQLRRLKAETTEARSNLSTSPRRTPRMRKDAVQEPRSGRVDAAHLANLQQEVSKLEQDLRDERRLGAALAQRCAAKADATLLEEEQSAEEQNLLLRRESEEQKRMLAEEEQLLSRLCLRLVASLSMQKQKLKTVTEQGQLPTSGPATPRGSSPALTPRGSFTTRDWLASSPTSQSSHYRKAFSDARAEVEQKQRTLQEYLEAEATMQKVCASLQERISESTSLHEHAAAATSSRKEDALEALQISSDATLAALKCSFVWELEAVREQVAAEKAEQRASVNQKVVDLRAEERSCLAQLRDHRAVFVDAARAREEQLASRQSRLHAYTQENDSKKRELRSLEQEAETLRTAAAAAKAESVAELKQQKQEQMQHDAAAKQYLAQAMHCEQQAVNSCSTLQKQWEFLNAECA